MNNETQHGYLILADISCSTSYVAGMELNRTRKMVRTGLPSGASVTAMAQDIGEFTRSSAAE